MLSRVLPKINPLPEKIKEQLRHVDDFYVCSHFTEDMVGNTVVKIGDDVYYRFMDYMYLPQPTESLSVERVIQICDLRLEYFDDLVNRQLNDKVVANLVKCVVPGFANVSTVKALDFGCGSGLSTHLLKKYMPCLDITGADISERAILESRKQGLVVEQTVPEKPLPFSDETFDVIFAVFVMHFRIGMETLAELRRVLQPYGKLVFNVYQRDIEAVLQQLQEVGFASIRSHSLTGTNADHKIVICSNIPVIEDVLM